MFFIAKLDSLGRRIFKQNILILRMEKRYSWNIQISAWLLLSMAILLFLANLCVYLYLSPAAKAISGKAEEEKGFLNLQINPPVIPISPGGGAGAGGGGGGGISGVDLQKIGKPFTISPSSMSISLVEGEKYCVSSQSGIICTRTSLSAQASCSLILFLKCPCL